MEQVANIYFDLHTSATWKKIYETGQSLLIEDTLEYPNWRIFPATQYIRCWIGVPLIATGSFIGFYSLDKAEPRFFTAEHVRLAETLAAQAAIAIQNARLYEHVQNHAQNLHQAVINRTRELTEMNKRLQELDRLKSKFISDVSHELRTPVANLSLYLDLLEQGDLNRHTHYQAVLRRQVERLSHIIEDILSISRLDLEGGDLLMEAVDLNVVVQQVIEAFVPRLSEGNLSLKTELQAGMPPVRGSREKLSWVVSNLLANAINYTPAGQIEIRTFEEPQEEQVCLHVRDTGMGIALEDRPYIFERFYRGKNTGRSNIPGSGLGLAIVKEIVDLHNGRITVQSEVNKGTTFEIFFPISEN